MFMVFEQNFDFLGVFLYVSRPGKWGGKIELDTYSERWHSNEYFEQKIKSISWKMTKWHKY